MNFSENYNSNKKWYLAGCGVLFLLVLVLFVKHCGKRKGDQTYQPTVSELKVDTNKVKTDLRIAEKDRELDILRKRLDSLSNDNEALKSKQIASDTRFTLLTIKYQSAKKKGDTATAIKICDSVTQEIAADSIRFWKRLYTNSVLMQRQFDSAMIAQRYQIEQLSASYSFLLTEKQKTERALAVSTKDLEKQTRKVNRKWNVSLGAGYGSTNFSRPGFSIGLYLGRTIIRF